MNLTELDNEVKITSISEFDLCKTFECGQCFRWSADGLGGYAGVAYGHAAEIRYCEGGVIISGTVGDFDAVWRDYFDLERDYTHIRRQLCVSDFMAKASEFGAGIRILRQEPWEALCTFILSQNNNIPRIKNMVSALCSLFGERISFKGQTLYTFPPAEKLAGLNDNDLSPLRSGYRAKYILAAAKAVADGALDLDALSTLAPTDAREELKRLPGVGDKVADCVLLYGLHMIDAFPVDVWIKRALAQHCGPDFDPSCFSPYAGIAQQYIFHYMRNSPSLRA